MPTTQPEQSPPAIRAHFEGSKGQADTFRVTLSGIPQDLQYVHLVLTDPDTPACRVQQGREDFWLKGLISSTATLKKFLQNQPCPFVHLEALNIPIERSSSPTSGSLQLSRLPSGAIYGLNSVEEDSFYPPNPPQGDPLCHHYHLAIFFSGTQLSAPEGDLQNPASAEILQKWLQKNSKAQTEAILMLCGDEPVSRE